MFFLFLGDVVLSDLKLKETCLDSLDLPIRTIYGHLGKIKIKNYLFEIIITFFFIY